MWQGRILSANGAAATDGVFAVVVGGVLVPSIATAVVVRKCCTVVSDGWE